MFETRDLNRISGTPWYHGGVEVDHSGCPSARRKYLEEGRSVCHKNSMDLHLICNSRFLLVVLQTQSNFEPTTPTSETIFKDSYLLPSFTGASILVSEDSSVGNKYRPSLSNTSILFTFPFFHRYASSISDTFPVFLRRMYPGVRSWRKVHPCDLPCGSFGLHPVTLRWRIILSPRRTTINQLSGSGCFYQFNTH